MKVKQILAFLLVAMLLVPLTGCNLIKKEESEVESEASIAKQLIPSDKAATVWDNKWADSTNGFTDASKIYGFDFYKNGALSTDNAAEIGSNDCKYVFFGEDKSRVVNVSDGYTVTLPTTEFKTDYSLSELRTRYSTDNFMLTVSKETGNPYGNTQKGWDIYYTEWLARFIDDLNFLGANNLRRSRAKQELTDMIDGYTVTLFNMQFSNKTEYKYQNYDIAIVRADDEYVEFYLFVMKSTTKQVEVLDNIVKSFTKFDGKGTAVNDKTPYELIEPDYWSDETKAYYDQLKNQTSVSWGVFSASMPEDNDSIYNAKLAEITEDQARLETAFNYKFDILPTYTPLSWGDNFIDFPSGQASELAGGNGFNNKPVLQFTYQFTTSNNGNLNSETPMFEILDGKYDAQFHKLAKQIKEYGKPVLFRLNNEMNTDWTSYAGIITLLDPDIFVDTWQRLYDIFLEEGVDNCIWIFNPVAISCPFSGWGDYLCYMPGVKYMQLLGLTDYEKNNAENIRTFKDMYTEYYKKNTPYFQNYPCIISEFGCGAGGEWDFEKNILSTKARNKDKQAKWVEDMFTYLNNNQDAKNAFCKNIKAAIWFSCNDSNAVDGKMYINNYFQLNDELTSTFDAFKKGLAK